MRALVVGGGGGLELADIAEPEYSGDELVNVLACGVCGSDLEKLLPAFAGRVLGHEVVARTRDGRRVALVHHAPCGSCTRCLAGHESTCERFAEETIVPGGFAERALAVDSVDVPDSLDDATACAIEPLACILRAAEHVPPGRVLIVGNGFIGRLFSAVLEQRGNDVFVADSDPRRAGRALAGSAGATVVCAPGAVTTALAALEPGGTLVCFADPGPIPGELVYRRELTVLGSRSATPAAMREAATLLPTLDLPGPTVLPLECFAEGLELLRRRDALKVVFVP